jgi:hypothetical protein
LSVSVAGQENQNFCLCIYKAALDKLVTSLFLEKQAAMAGFRDWAGPVDLLSTGL